MISHCGEKVFLCKLFMKLVNAGHCEWPPLCFKWGKCERKMREVSGPWVIKHCKHQHEIHGASATGYSSNVFPICMRIHGRAQWRERKCISGRHGAAVELFTLITFPLMPAACRNQRAPSGPKKPVMWPAFVVCWSWAWERQGEWECTENFDRIFFFFFSFQKMSFTTHLTCCLQK